MNILSVRNLKMFLVGFGGLLVLAVVALGFFYEPSAYAQQNSQTAPILSGYAWSSNIGWIKMSNCATDGTCTGISHGVAVEQAGTTRKLSGYAWSSNIGWVSFDTTATTGCPDGDCQARIEWGSGSGEAKMVGWARACSVLKSNCQANSGLVDDTERGGWDGFIALYRSSGSPEFGVVVDTTTGNFSGEAWGSDIVGWVDFSGVKLIDAEPPCDPADKACVCLADPNAPICQACDPNDLGCICSSGSSDDPRCDCQPTDPCYCEPGGPGVGTNDCPCTVVGTQCWCADHPGQCVSTADQCSNIPGNQDYVPQGSSQVSDGAGGTKCVCLAGSVLKLNETNGQWQCTKIKFNEF